MFRMLRWSAAPAMAFVLMTSAGPVEAQVTATVVMKSGERHQGQNPWTRVDKGEFSLRKSQNDELRVSASEVAYVDFGGSADAPISLSGSQQAVVLRNGSVVKGQIVEMGHATPTDQSTEYLVMFRDEQGQERRYPGNQVARVYFSGNNTAATTGTANQADGSAGVTVSSKQQWTPTGITVRRGERVTFNATGEIQLGLDAGDAATAAGARSQRMAPGAPLPRAAAGTLIGRIGENGAPFAIGTTRTIQMPAEGVLYLGINDDGLNDNSGEFRVEIQRSGNPLRRR